MKYGQCRKCGENMVGDGYTQVLQCPNAGDLDDKCYEPDAGPIECDFED